MTVTVRSRELQCPSYTRAQSPLNRIQSDQPALRAGVTPPLPPQQVRLLEAGQPHLCWLRVLLASAYSFKVQRDCSLSPFIH